MSKLSDKVLANAQRVMGQKSPMINSMMTDKDSSKMDSQAKSKHADVDTDVDPSSDRSANPKMGEEEKLTAEQKMERRISRAIGEKKSMGERLEQVMRENEELKRGHSAGSGERETQSASVSATAAAPKLEDFKDVNSWRKAFEEHTVKTTHERVRGEVQAENANKDTMSRFSKMMENGKKASKDYGLTPEEYEDRVGSKDIRVHRAAQKILLESPYSHHIALDIANDMESFNKMSAEDQIKHIAKKEFHYEAKESGSMDTQPKTTKASTPDRDLAQGFGHVQDDKKLSKDDGSVNWNAVRKTVKSRGRGW